jgi:hypothetical protein
MDIYRTLKTGEPYVDEGAEAVFERNSRQSLARMGARACVGLPPGCRGRYTGSREGAKPQSSDEKDNLATTFLISALRKLLIEW